MNWKLLNENVNFDDVLTCLSPLSGKTPNRSCEINKTFTWVRIKSIINLFDRKVKVKVKKLKVHSKLWKHFRILTHFFLSCCKIHWIWEFLMISHDMAPIHQKLFLHLQGEFSFEIDSISSMETSLLMSLRRKKNETVEMEWNRMFSLSEFVSFH